VALPQVPLTLGNAVIAITEENNRLFPNRPVSAGRIATEIGLRPRRRHLDDGLAAADQSTGIHLPARTDLDWNRLASEHRLIDQHPTGRDRGVRWNQRSKRQPHGVTRHDLSGCQSHPHPVAANQRRWRESLLEGA
jgi:hypothetical protein